MMPLTNTEPDILKACLEKISQSSVLVIGDIMLDRFVYGEVQRISPEGPVPVLQVKKEHFMLGGSGNALSNLAGLGAKAEIIALIGADEEGKNIRAQIKGLGFSGDHLLESTNRNTIVKTRYLAGHQQLLRTDYEDKSVISDALAEELIANAAKLIPDMNALIFSDYGKGLLRDDVIRRLIETAKAHNVPVIVDPKGTDFAKYKGARAITPNKKELSEACGNCTLENDAEIVNAAEKILDQCEIETVIATRSGEGISVISQDKEALHIPGADIEVFDVSGAGDTVIATLAAALGTGADIKTAATLANIAGSIVVTKTGTAAVRHEELSQALESDWAERLTSAARGHIKAERTRRGEILEWDAAGEQIRRWQARGLKVGFTNGCFDILHYGHVTYLNDARDHCDRLVMGLNKDSSIRILKGPERPVHDEQSRAAVLAALGSIDMVVFFGADTEGDDNTACALLETLKPDIYFKGGDYTVDQIPEAPTVLKNKGEVKVMPVYEGHSTTNSIKKIKA